MDLQTIWFLIIGVLVVGYTILDGFDFGVGILHLFTKTDHERRISMNSIGPVWDGNEVWLVTAGGAAFAAFPNAYATVFSAFYIPFMLLLLALIFRAVALEFRSKEPWKWWRSMWDVAFSGSSILASILFGVLLGNLVVGIPVGRDYEFAGGMIDLLQPFSILTGLFSLSVFAMHGSIYLYLKTEGDLQERVREWIFTTFGIFAVMYILTTVYTLVVYPGMVVNFSQYPWAWAIVVLTVMAIANIPRALYLRLPFRAFVSSCFAIAGMLAVFAVGVFPNLMVSSLNPEWSITIYNAASSEKTLTIMLIIALIGMPFVLTYTGIIYWVFRGKVKLEPHSY